MKIHERVFKAKEAKIELAMAVNKIMEKHQLTYGEINGMLLEVAQSWNGYAIRDERHPDDPEKAAGEA